MQGSVVTVGRVSVDLYAREAGASFRDQQTFSKSVGGSPTNVAVAAARLGHRATLVTKVGDDELGGYVVERLRSWGVDTSSIGVSHGNLTPVVLAALDPPEEPKLIFHRQPDAPDTSLLPTDLSKERLGQCDVFWMSGCALSRGSTAESSLYWLKQRNRSSHTVLDLDYRPSFWASINDARRAAQAAIDWCSVVVGNRTECAMALGTDDPERAADMLIERGVSLAIVKMGAAGVLLATKHERAVIKPLRITLVCGLGSGDAFGGALIHGLVNGWDIRTIGEHANAAGAYVATQLTCADAMPDIKQLTSFMNDPAHRS
ncbi:MAG: 5-dehydro-2-deoxygluconokinase [Actinobacteria bacterium]|jgi:5-dehydro-2-deoxygluconokinase|nr:5-dehydro-2-deoxygluconokinase [Actinomycetota bacterium]NCW90519.1 5-dehydro-2-deoxygluconokinase [Acidimicrobiia bacterium]NCV09041.1 5-dehydro-2-deoxygluconokinase [Actinomycetota bacterium]NCV47346.1 5-dehydro-2-deoxygluconokinase [Actinomycetota bacterium]NCX31139.1 5-dehydro-2-deoxygluconokinase [Actinomycetota bacterium]